MESVGSQLRQARLTLGLTLEEVQRRTCISLKNLSAIEKDELSQFNSPFFYRSFVKQIAKQLEVDYDLLAPAVQQCASTIPEPLVPGQTAPGSAEAIQANLNACRERRPKNLQWLYSLLSFALMLVACSSFYGVWQQSRSNWHAQLAAILNFLMPPTRNTSAGPVQQSVAPLAPALTVPSAFETAAQPLVELPTENPSTALEQHSALLEGPSPVSDSAPHAAASHRRHRLARSSHRLRSLHRSSSVPSN